MKARVLLVDDYPGVRDSLGHMLCLEGYDVTVAANGREALDSLRQTGFDLVLLDLDMPVINGWDTLGQIVTSNLSLPLIVITGHPDQQWLATQKGVAAFLEKPLDMNLLLEVMKRVLAPTAQARGGGTSPKSP